MKRVACLYRVSTKRQTEENDIPMQKNACRKFIENRPDWRLAAEYVEAGISGYHKSAAKRDVLMKARNDAANGQFDVLLVFMFDRLGRREDETPFIVEWFHKQGVEVWSVAEGQQKFESSVDKLLNYIRFWQSGGESEKTSLRVSEAHRQMVLAGKFRGGAPPFGYTLRPSGEMNKRGVPLHRLAIDESEAHIVRKLYDLAANHGYGGRRLARYLNERGIPTKNGNAWTAVSVLNLLKNPIYYGQVVSGRRKNNRGEKNRVSPDNWVYADKIDENLAIVSIVTWRKAEALRISRQYPKGPQPLQTRGPLLFSGIAVCGVCGSRLVTRYKQKRNGQAAPVYTCPQRRAVPRCEGQASFAQSKIEPAALTNVYAYLSELDQQAFWTQVKRLIQIRSKTRSGLLKQTTSLLKKAENDGKLLRREIAASLCGGPFTPEQLREALAENDARIADYKRRIQEQSSAADIAHGLLNQPVNLCVLFQDAPPGFQKNLLARLVDRLAVSKGLLEVEYAFALRQ